MNINNISLNFILRSNKGFVLVGHGVDDRPKDPFVEELHQNAESVKKILVQLKELGFKFIGINELLKIAKNNFQSSFPWIHLSFDDGYKNNFTHALPIAKELEVPFSIFLSTHHIKTNEPMYTFKLRVAALHSKSNINLLGVHIGNGMSREERIMAYRKFAKKFKTLQPNNVFELINRVNNLFTPNDWENFKLQYPSDILLNNTELKTLATEPLVYLGAHAHHHVLLNKYLTEDQLHQEIIKPKQYLLENLGVNTVAFAYPNGKIGDFTNQSEKQLNETGYQLGFTAIKGLVIPGTNQLTIPRVSIPNILNKSFFTKLLGIPYEKVGKVKFFFSKSANIKNLTS